MDIDVKRTEKEEEETLHKVAELHSSRVISKKSSLGCSSRISYYRSAEGVPFQWEKKPGKAIDPPKEAILPPLSPPPAVLSLGLPKPSISFPEPNKKTSLVLKFWKRIMKNHARKGARDGFLQERSRSLDVVNKRVKYCCSSDGEFMASPRNSSCSSLSSVMSFSNDQARQPSGLEASIGSSIRRPFGCGVISFPSVSFRRRH